MWKSLLENFSQPALALVLWLDLLSLPFSRLEHSDFWEELSAGWMRDYVWPYDDIYGVSRHPSPERILRLGARKQ